MSAGGIQKKAVSAGFLLGTRCLTAGWGSPCARHRNYNYNIFCQTQKLYQQHILSNIKIISTTYSVRHRHYINNIFCQTQTLYQQHMRQCQIRVRFECRVKTKFLAALNQLLKSFFHCHHLPQSHSFQKRYDMQMVVTFVTMTIIWGSQ